MTGPLRAIPLGALALWLAAPPAQAEQIACPQAREPWLLEQGAVAPGTIVLQDGAARAVCTYRHQAAGTRASVAFAWIARGAAAASPDPLLRCDPAVFARQDPGSHFNAELGATVHPSRGTLGYVAISPAPPGAREDAQRWDAMRWTAQFALAEEVEPRAAICRRMPGRDVTERAIAPASVERVGLRFDGRMLEIDSTGPTAALLTLAREPVRDLRARAALKVIGGRGRRFSHMAGLLLAREQAAGARDGDLFVGVAFTGDQIVMLRREGARWQVIAARPTDLVAAVAIVVERWGEEYTVTVDGAELGRAPVAPSRTDWVRFYIDDGVMAELSDWRVDALP